jgi:3-O-methylgallate 3,4-dioxygenase
MVILDDVGWAAWAERDRTMTELVDDRGVVRTYDECLALAPPEIADELGPGVFAAKVERCRKALAILRDRIAEMALDALIVVGDDQSEHLFADNLPPFLLYHGPTIPNTVARVPAGASAIVHQVQAAYYEPDGDVDHPVDTELADHLVEHLLDHGFDIATSARLPRDRAEGHAIQFPHRWLLPSGLPIVPLFVNTYFPPSQPRARRCLALGDSLAAAVAAAPGNTRIGVMASGGLSHFLVLTYFDNAFLDAIAADDREALVGLPEAVLRSGTSEVKNWLVAAGACHGLHFDVVDYVPGYRTAAGTGTGLCFALWG